MNCKNKSFITKKKAFTLVELLIVISIIGILFIVLVSKVDFATDKAKASGVQTDFRSFQMAFDTVAKENAGFNTFGWDTGDANQDGIRNSYDEGDTNKDGIQNGTEVFTGHKVYAETFTKVFSLKKNGTGSYDRDALNRLETAINANLDPKLHITIKDDGEIVMANGAQDPWNKEYHGYYITNAETDGKDRGAIVMYSDGANNEFGSEHTIANGIVTVSVPGSNKAGKDDYSIVSIYTYVNGYGEIKNATTGFSNNQTITGTNNSGITNNDNNPNDEPNNEPPAQTLKLELNEFGFYYNAGYVADDGTIIMFWDQDSDYRYVTYLSNNNGCLMPYNYNLVEPNKDTNTLEPQLSWRDPEFTYNADGTVMTDDDGKTFVLDSSLLVDPKFAYKETYFVNINGLTTSVTFKEIEHQWYTQIAKIDYTLNVSRDDCDIRTYTYEGYERYEYYVIEIDGKFSCYLDIDNLDELNNYHSELECGCEIIINSDTVTVNCSHEYYCFDHGNFIVYIDGNNFENEDCYECVVLSDLYHLLFYISPNSNNVIIDWAGE